VSSNIGQANFIEVIWVNPYSATSCYPNVILGRSHWQNPVNRFDVNDDGVVSIEDYTDLQDWLNNNGEQTLDALKPDAEPYVDINGDGVATNKDLTLLSQFLNDKDAVDRSAETCYNVSDFRLGRDLLDPSLIATVQYAAITKGVTSTNYNAYIRDYNTNTLESINFSASTKTKDSLVFVHKDLLVITEASAMYIISQNTDGWQNPLSQYDINGDGSVDQDDIDDLTDWLATNGAQELPSTRLAEELFVDVDGDGFADSTDLAILQSYITANGAQSVPNLQSVVVIGDGTTSACTPSFPVLDRIRARIASSEILPDRFVWP
jgi:Ca2+-binding EF-hand superfamily protein